MEEKIKSTRGGPKPYHFTEERWAAIEAAMTNGSDISEIAIGLGISKTRLEFVIKNTRGGQVRLQNARKRITNDAVANLKRLADGMTVVDREYTSSAGDRVLLKMYKDKLIKALEGEDYKKFMDILSSTATESGVSIKVKEREYPPNLAANQKLLEVLETDKWDMESRRKKIPQIRIDVRIDDKTIEKIIAPYGKRIKSDYVVENIVS